MKKVYAEKESQSYGLWALLLWRYSFLVLVLGGCGGKDKVIEPEVYTLGGIILHQNTQLVGISVVLSGDLQDTVQTGIDGRFVFVDVPAGEYTVQPLADERMYSPARIEVSLAGKDIETVDFFEDAPLLAISDERIEVDGAPTRNVVNLFNVGSRMLEWTLQKKAAWVEIQVTKGALGADGLWAGRGATELVLFTQGEGLEAGVYADTLYITSNGGDRTIVVQMEVVADQTNPPTLSLVDVIVFVTSDDIWTVKIDGRDLINLTNGIGINRSPSWSPDGRQIVFSRTEDFTNTGTNFDLWLMDADGGNRIHLTGGFDESYQEAHPAWSPDGEQIAFIRQRFSEGGVDTQLWLMNADGSNARELDLGLDYRYIGSPAWSPDGRKLAFPALIGGIPPDIWMVDVVRGDLVNLSNDSSRADSAPSWSPDGRRLVFTASSRSANNLDIFIMNADGSGQSKLTDNPGDDMQPCWSPDGQGIIYVSSDEPHPHDSDSDADSDAGPYLYSMNIDGSNRTRLLDQTANSPAIIRISGP